MVSGPSGSGKTTLLENALMDRKLSKVLVRSVSYTTRPKRSGEVDGKDYFFISEDDFRSNRRQKKILEWTRYLDYYYATPREFVEKVLREKKSIILCLDVKGAMQVRRIFPLRTILIFVMPPCLDVLESRISGRSGDILKEELLSRVKIAKTELKYARQYDYIIVNEDLKRASSELKDIISVYLK